jgi:aryl-alcohol dehydrogenase-like predicted oxidoreductase
MLPTMSRFHQEGKMEYRKLGRTGLNVSILGLGSGGASRLGQGSGVPEADAHKVVDMALANGVNIIDTAAAYGDSELILGRALQKHPRDSYVLCTKANPASVTRGDGPPTYTYRTEQEFIESCERSLTRLQTDFIDVFQVHGVVPETYPHVRDHLVPALRKLQDQGKVRFIGITEVFSGDHERELLKMSLADNHFDTIMIGYNLLTPGPEDDVLPLATANDVGVLVMCAVRKKIAKPSDLNELIASLKHRNLLPHSVPDTGALDWLLHDGVDSVTDACYRFAQEPAAVSTVLTGTANVNHLEQNLRAILAGNLPAADRQRLKETFGPVGLKLGESIPVS